jgi:Transposase DDE domain group 1
VRSNRRSLVVQQPADNYEQLTGCHCRRHRTRLEQWIDRVHDRRPPRGIVLDMDSSVSPTHGEQEMRAWNGHFACTCYHPLFAGVLFPH